MASCSRRADEWNVREVWVWSRDEGIVGVWRKARIEGVRILEAIGFEEGRTEGWSLGCNVWRLLGKGCGGEYGCGKECGLFEDLLMLGVCGEGEKRLGRDLDLSAVDGKMPRAFSRNKNASGD